MPELADPAALEDIKGTLAEATKAIEDMKRGLVDEETVHRMIREAAERSRGANKRHEDGYQPTDEDDDRVEHKARSLKGRARLDFILERDHKRAASALRLPASDVLAFQRACDSALILGAALKKDVRELAYYREEVEPLVRAMDTATSAEGLEYVPTLMSSNLIDRINLELQVAGLFGTFQMPTPTFDFPAYGVSRQRLGNHAQQTADTGQTKFVVRTPATRKVTFTAKKFAGEVLVSKEAEEDMIVPILPWIEGEIVDYVAADIEDTILNGDTAGGHMDSDVTAGTDPRKNWDGLRKNVQTGAKTDGSNAVLTVALLRSSRKKMGKYGIRPADLATIAGINSYFNLLSDANVITVDKYGPQATVLSGELGKVDGMPLVVSEYARIDLNATGVYDGATTNRGIALIANRRAFMRGLRRDVTVQRLTELYAESDQDAVIASTRQAFNVLFPSTELVVASVYNLAA